MNTAYTPLVLAILIGLPSQALGQLTSLGTMGDSLTDEYAEQSYDYARSWTELLVEQRTVDVGPTAAAAGVGTWGEPRRTGFEFNWARFGATTNDLINTGQHTGLLGSATSGGISHAVMFIGGNDFSPWSGAYDEIYDGTWDQADIDFFTAGVVQNALIAVETTRPAGVRLVVASIPDFSMMPFVIAGHPDAIARDEVTAALSAANAQLRQLAQENGLVFCDLFGLAKAMFGSRALLRERNPGARGPCVWGCRHSGGRHRAVR